QVVDRLLGLDAEHDRGVPELEVQVEQQRLPLLELRQGTGEVRGRDRLARPALGREDREDLPAPATAGRVDLTRRVGRLANREDDASGPRDRRWPARED